MATGTTNTSQVKDSKLQDPDADLKPRVSGDDMPDLVYRLYGLKMSDVSTFASYDDLIFCFQVQEPWDNPYITALNPDGYILKIINGLQSETPEFIDAQATFTSHLRERGIGTQEPVLNKQGARWSLETFSGDKQGEKTGPYIVRLMTFIPGPIFRHTPWVPGSFYNIGTFLGRFREAAKGFRHPFYDTYNTIWSLEQVPVLRDFLVAVKDENDVKIVTDVIETFEREVKPLFNKFTKGTVHADCNDRNLVMYEVPGQENVPTNARVHDVRAALDFADTKLSYIVMDVAISIAYLSIECPPERQLDVGGHVLAGYLKVSSLNEEELSSLRTLTAARLCTSLVLGAHNFMKFPHRTNVMTTSARGWPLLRKLWGTESSILYARWKSILNN